MSLEKLWKEAKHVLAFVLAIALFFNGWANYDFSVFAEGEQLTVTLSAHEAVYTGGDLKPLITSVKENDVDVEYKDSNVTWTDENGDKVTGAIQDAGTYKVTVSVEEGNNAKSGSATFEVKTLKLSECQVYVNKNYTYTGQAIVPDEADVTVTSGSTTVDKNLYSVIAEENINAGTATVKVSGVNSNVTGTASGTFEIEKAVLAVEWSDETYTYDGTKVHYPTATVNGKKVDKPGTENAVEVASNVTVTLSVENLNNVEPGNYTAGLQLSDTMNYQLMAGKETFAYSVNKIGISSDMFEYDKSAILAANIPNHIPEIKLTDGTVIPNENYTVAFSKDGASVTTISEVGVYNVVITATDENPHYQGSVSETFEVKYSDAAPAVTVSNNTLNGEWYRDNVTISVETGYVIAKTEAEVKDLTYTNTNVVYTTAVDNCEVYLRSTADDTISKQSVGSFKIDIIKPTVEFDTENTNAGEADWLSEKHFTVKSSDPESEVYGCYYTTDEKKKLTVETVNGENELADLTLMDSNLVSITNQIGKNETVIYYVYAVDKAGRVSSQIEIPVTKVDAVTPTVTLDESTKNFEVTNTDEKVYWNNGTELKIPITNLSDDLSGVTSVTLIKDGGTPVELGTNISELSITGTDASQTASQTAGRYVLSVKDDAENEATCEFTVKVDTSAPELTLTEPNHDDKYKEGDVFWYPTADLAINVSITDLLNTGDTEISANKVYYSINDGAFVEVEPDANGNVNITLAKGDSNKYTFKIVDIAGNPSAEKTLQLGYAPDAPVIESVVINPVVDENGDGVADEWINKSELGDDGKVEFTVTITDEFTGIKTISYQHDKDDPVEVKISEADKKNSTFTIVTEKAYSECKNCKWTFTATNNVNKTSDSKTTDPIAGIDIVEPENVAYIKFISDTTGSNQSAGSIWEMAKDTWNKIWGKTTINFEIYVYDATSGIDSFIVKYTGDGKDVEIPVSAEDFESGLKAFVEGETDAKDAGANDKGYYVYKKSITTSANSTLSIKNFKIVGLTDVAGNTLSDDIVLYKADENIIYLDNVAPEISISYTDENERAIIPEMTKKVNDFYKNTVYADIKVKERFFGEDGVYPVIVLNTTQISEDNTIKTNEVKIETEAEDWVPGEDYTYTYKSANNSVKGLKLELQSAKEAEYNFTFSYTDPSGNVLEGNDIENGIYSSRVIAIDNLAPKLESYEVEGSTDYKFNDIAIYKNKETADLTLKFSINDNFNYSDLAKNNLVVKVYRDKGDTPETINAVFEKLEEDDVTGRKHLFKAEYNGNDSIENIVYIEIAYADEVGLALENDTDLTAVDGKIGTYRSVDYIMDHVKPELSSVTIDEQDVVAKPGTEDDGKYFYKEEKTLKLTIDEGFFAGTDNIPIIKPEVELRSRTDVNEEFWTEEYTDKVSWTKTDDGVWETTIELPGNDEIECEYQVVLEYADASTNKLTGDGVKEGTFISQIFVIDKVAPEITSYEVERTTDCDVASEFSENGAEVRKNDTTPNADDLIVTFAIDDNASYYELSKEKLVVNLYRDNSENPVLTLDYKDKKLKHNDNGRSHTYSFGYDGAVVNGVDSTENEFYVEISYRDQADNALENKTTILTSIEDKDDTYKSGQFIIDHVAPVFNVEYSDAVNVVKDGKDNGKQPLSEHTAYYNGNIDVTLTFDEKYVNTLSDNSLEHCVIEITKDGTQPSEETTEETKVQLPKITWSHEGRTHTAKFTIAAEDNHSADGNYQIVVKYRDCAFNPMSGDAENVDLKNLMSIDEKTNVGVYTSPILVLDTTAPVVITKYMNGETEVQPEQTAYGRDYFNDVNTAFQITVEDRNIRYKELKNVLKGMDAYNIDKTSISGTDLKKEIDDIADTGVMYANGKENAKIWTLNLPLSTKANYDIPVNFVDLAGNAAVVNGSVGTFTEQVTTDSTIPGLDLSYSIDDPANYWEWGYLFAKKKMTVTVTATDEIAGVQTIKFTIVDENGKETVKTETFKPVGKSTYSVDIPLKTEDFKGSIFAEVFDYSTNTNSQKRGHIVESTSKHSATGTAKITTLTNPSRTVGGVDFYNTDVKFQLLLEDTYSGLGSWEYTGGETLKDTATYKADAGTDLTKDPSIRIVPKLDRTLTLDAQKNNKNDVLVKASFVDNVGHELSIEQKYNIDVTKPTITVEYDLNEPANEKYYKETRTATVKITERNFDSSDVEFIITSTDGPKPEISGWSKSGTGDNTVHTCTVTFAQDSDYTFTLKFRDMAGNVADYDRVDEFTIDKTIPVATVTYDNNSFLNEYYYDAARTATIDILEHNFDPSAMEIMVTADGSTAGVPHISAWSSNGDHNIATITFSADAEYTFDFVGMDLALNELEDYTPDHFVVDQTAPELEIFDIEHMSANNGMVRPGIRYHDTNYDQNGTVILMTGYHNGVVEMTGDRKLEANGLELKLDDFAYVQEMDDIYTMEATVYDLAGNSSEAMVMFSVNRFGSVYTFDEATDALIGDNGKYYTNKEQQLVITETNVDTLEFKEITLNLNGKLTTLKEGVDYTVALDGNDATWKQYTYTLKADNFVEEGTYILTIYSEDRATNTSDNNTKGKKIEFVVDKTNPSALISGVENGGQYRMHSKEMTIDIEDNVRLSSVTVTIDGVESVYDAAQIQKMDGKLVMNIGSANHWQNVVVEVTDAAGNTEISEEMRVLVTANIFVQFFMNKPVFYGTLGGTALLAALLWWFLVGKKKKEEQAK